MNMTPTEIFGMLQLNRDEEFVKKMRVKLEPYCVRYSLSNALAHHFLNPSFAKALDIIISAINDPGELCVDLMKQLEGQLKVAGICPQKKYNRSDFKRHFHTFRSPIGDSRKYWCLGLTYPRPEMMGMSRRDYMVFDETFHRRGYFVVYQTADPFETEEYRGAIERFGLGSLGMDNDPSFNYDVAFYGQDPDEEADRVYDAFFNPNYAARFDRPPLVSEGDLSQVMQLYEFIEQANQYMEKEDLLRARYFFEARDLPNAFFKTDRDAREELLQDLQENPGDRLVKIYESTCEKEARPRR
ncbi:MAG: hypothetical protein IJM30_12215 [Thermoguttaceae bacterium]|nr:hypothetical protein [Thermoguttaceae bacterium]